MRTSVRFGTGRAWAADHKHQRQEILLGITGELWLIWRDESGERQEQKMLREDGKLQLFVIAPYVPHLVENRSTTESASLHEWSNLKDEAELLTGSESLR